MMETKFTPGPWEAHKRRGTFYIMSQHVRHPNATGGWADVAYLCVSNGCDINDAHLIAAAPDLYEALVDARKAVTLLEDLTACGADDDYVAQLSATIEAALRKARGESHPEQAKPE